MPLMPLRIAALSLALASAAHAATINALPRPPDAQGPGIFGFNGAGGSHTQTVFDAGFFAAAPGPQNITAIAFSRYFFPFFNQLPGPLTSSFPDLRITLSTTSRGDERGTPLSANFAANTGADATTVVRGPFTVFSPAPVGFDYLITFQTPFLYNAALGNLLVDVVLPAGARPTGVPGFNQVNDFNDGIYSVFNGDSATAVTGFPDTAGVVARLIAQPAAAQGVPEPMSLGLLGAGLLGLGVVARRGRRA